MKHIQIKKGLGIPILGAPEQVVDEGSPVSQVALLGDDVIGMTPTLAVQAGDKAKTGQLLFSDMSNAGIAYISPGCGTALSVNCGGKRAPPPKMLQSTFLTVFSCQF